jgi:hypothetical protein
MTQDWNWFFSSLSQSAAAIVGIFGAFIITKIFSHQSLFIEKSNRIKQLVNQARRISETANSFNVKWLNDGWNESEYRDFHQRVDDTYPDIEDAELIPDDFLDDFIKEGKFSRYTDRNDIMSELRHIARSIANENTYKRRQKEHAERAKEGDQNLAFPTISNMMRSLTIANTNQKSIHSSFQSSMPAPWDALGKTREGLGASYREARHHARESAIFLESIEGNPESPRLISLALLLVLIIFFSGVIYPLSFMPASGPPNIELSIEAIKFHVCSFKGFLLGLIGTAFTVIVTIFFVTNDRMKYLASDIEQIRKLTDVSWYCDSFKFVAQHVDQD